MPRVNSRTGFSVNHHPSRHRQAGTAAVLALAVVAAGVWWSGGTDTRRQTARALAEAIATGDFSAVPLDGATPDEASARRASAYGGLGPAAPDVRVGAVVPAGDGDDCTDVELRFRWTLEGSPDDWTYSTRVELVRVDGTWRARWDPAVLAPELTADETLQQRRVRAARAPVLGAGGVPLVTDRPVWRIGVDRARTDPTQVEASARALAAALGMDADAYAARALAAGDRAFVEAIVIRLDDPGYSVDELTAVPGVVALPDRLPLAPDRAFARQLLGTVGQATAEIVDASGGAVVAGDLVGLGGLQGHFDARLRGVPGTSVVATGGAADRTLHRVEPQQAEPLRLTLDPAVQQAADQVLARVTGSASALVAIRPSTGEVLAAASGPGGDGTSTASLGLYAPGSTLKVASALALLRAGMTPDSEVSCPPTTTVDGRTFHNYPDYPAGALGTITLRTAVAESCNTAFLTAADRVPLTALADAAAALGLTAGTDLGFPAALGSVPTDDAGATDHAASMIGQGRVQATPLGMAAVAASVVAGHRVTPHLIADAELAGEPPATSLTGDEAAALRSLMRAVVTDGGARALADVPGPEVIAKSGTAQYGSAESLRNHAWMIAGQGDLAVAVFVETGDYGSTTSGPLLADFLRAVRR
jgi:cell division protein FtsI/penicillin-binding protein 2